MKTSTIILNRTGPVYDYDNFVKYDTDILYRKKDKQTFVNTVIGANPKLRDPFRPEPIPLDRPPLKSEMFPSQMYDPRPSSKYTCYSDIEYGNIFYWLPERPHIYDPLLFTIPSVIKHSVRIDPMNVIYPKYTRFTKYPYSWDDHKTNDCLSSTHDMLEYRNSLMESQMQKRNSQESKYYI